MIKSKRHFLLSLLITATMHLNAGSIRIMPVGNSITQGYIGGIGVLADGYQSGYRFHLWNSLTSANYNVDFVGSRNHGYAKTPSFDYNHEGYAGWTTHNIANHIYGFLVNNQPDIILLHIGSNDVSPSQANSSSVSGLNDILNEIDTYENDYNHPIHIVLATIIQRNSFYHQTLRDYNQNLINLANSRIADGDKITLIADMEYRLSPNDYSDGAHPNNSGYHKMSNSWFLALKDILGEPNNNAWLIPAVYNVMLN